MTESDIELLQGRYDQIANEFQNRYDRLSADLELAKQCNKCPTEPGKNITLFMLHYHFSKSSLYETSRGLARNVTTGYYCIEYVTVFLIGQKKRKKMIYG